MKSKNLKFIIGVILIIVIILGAFLIYNFVFQNNNKESNNLVNINMTDLEQKINSKETFMLVISQTGCSHCEQYLPELDRTLSDYDLKANVLNISNLSDSDSKKLSQYANFSGTPTTMFFIDGEEKTSLNRLVGYASKDKIVERLQSLGYVK